MSTGLKSTDSLAEKDTIVYFGKTYCFSPYEAMADEEKVGYLAVFQASLIEMVPKQIEHGIDIDQVGIDVHDQ